VANEGVQILDNKITHCGEWGILTGFSQNVLIEGNSTSGSVKQHGIYVGNSADNPIIRGNKSFGNRQCGIHINADANQGGDGVITNALVENNIIHDNGAGGGAGINMDGVQSSTIQNNLLYNNHATGIAIFRQDGAEPSKNNVVVNNTIAMANDARWAILIRDGSTGCMVLNNIVCTAHRFHGGLDVEEDALPGLVSDYNVMPDRFTTDGGDNVPTLAQWRAKYNKDAHTFFAKSGALFVNFDKADFHLSADSPAVDAGTADHAPKTDLEGHVRPQGKGVDAGAYESGGVTSAAGLDGRLSADPDGRHWRRWPIPIGIVTLGFMGGFRFLTSQVWARGLHRWMGSYWMQRKRRIAPIGGGTDRSVHLLLCIADHFEPQNGEPSADVALSRVQRWQREYPANLGMFRDSDGRPPRHSFFYPLEQYEEQEMNGIVDLCRRGFGEVEVHLHHDHDTSENLRRRLTEYKRLLAFKHGMLSRRRGSNDILYGFIHGNWALDNSRPDGRWCGVNNELDILRETGCYADFTLPSFPSPTQTRKINSIYYATDDPNRPRSHDGGVDAGAAVAPRDSLMLIQGPLLFDWRRKKWGAIPRVENGCLQANQVPTMARLDLWLRAGVRIPTRPDWYFVKLHTHGAPEANAAMLLGEPMRRFHAGLASRAEQDSHFRYHYVTAREMYNLVKAAESGWSGDVVDALDFELVWNGSVGATTAPVYATA
jgi:parallel beta-helix repeat protein